MLIHLGCHGGWVTPEGLFGSKYMSLANITRWISDEMARAAKTIAWKGNEDTIVLMPLEEKASLVGNAHRTKLFLEGKQHYWCDGY